MKSKLSFLSTGCAAALLLAAPAFAQSGAAASGTPAQSAVYQTPQGELTVNSMPAKAPSYGPAPAFDQLAHGSSAITAEQADAYPPLANDFEHADQNRDHKIGQAEYARWLKQNHN